MEEPNQRRYNVVNGRSFNQTGSVDPSLWLSDRNHDREDHKTESHLSPFQAFIHSKQKGITPKQQFAKNEMMSVQSAGFGTKFKPISSIDSLLSLEKQRLTMSSNPYSSDAFAKQLVQQQSLLGMQMSNQSAAQNKSDRKASSSPSSSSVETNTNEQVSDANATAPDFTDRVSYEFGSLNQDDGRKDSPFSVYTTKQEVHTTQHDSVQRQCTNSTVVHDASQVVTFAEKVYSNSLLVQAGLTEYIVTQQVRHNDEIAAIRQSQFNARIEDLTHEAEQQRIASEQRAVQLKKRYAKESEQALLIKEREKQLDVQAAQLEAGKIALIAEREKHDVLLADYLHFKDLVTQPPNLFFDDVGDVVAFTILLLLFWIYAPADGLCELLKKCSLSFALITWYYFRQEYRKARNPRYFYEKTRLTRNTIDYRQKSKPH